MAVLSDSFFSTARRRQWQQRTRDGSRYLVRVILLLCLMSLITLGQTGVVATKGYAVATLHMQRTELIRTRNHLEARYAAAQSLDHIRKQAERIGLRPAHRDQMQYITVVDTTLAHEPTTQPQHDKQPDTTMTEATANSSQPAP